MLFFFPIPLSDSWYYSDFSQSNAVMNSCARNSFVSLSEYFLGFNPESIVTESEGIKVLRFSLHMKRLVFRISAH